MIRVQRRPGLPVDFAQAPLRTVRTGDPVEVSSGAGGVWVVSPQGKLLGKIGLRLQRTTRLSDDADEVKLFSTDNKPSEL